jgi:hypothetical protein
MKINIKDFTLNLDVLADYYSLDKRNLFSVIILSLIKSHCVQAMKVIVVAALLCFATVATSGQAATYGDTNQAYTDCKLYLENGRDLNAEESRRAKLCLNFVIGAWDMGEYLAWGDIFTGKDPLFCPPVEEIGVVQPIQIFVNYVKKHPDKLEDHLPIVLGWSFQSAYPCTDDYFIKLVN